MVSPGLAPALLPLVPLSCLFGLLTSLRRAAYRTGLLRSERVSAPVIVIGNLIAGGAGKTPLTLWLVDALKQRGKRPGIISRGYGADVQSPRLVSLSDTAADCGDEPLLLAQRTGVPVMVCRDRVKAAHALLAQHPECDVIVADDGLQHYRLARAVELAVFDGRGAGNGWLLPAGPLREPIRRLATVDAIVLNMAEAPADVPKDLPRFAMRLQGDRFKSLTEASQSCSAEALAGKPLHAYAGIGDPKRFFRHLEALGLSFTAHPFPDHHHFSSEDFLPAKDGVVLLTEKDAVKCAGLFQGEAWVLPVSADIEPGLIETILEKLNGRKAA